jgi:hypothetical protein
VSRDVTWHLVDYLELPLTPSILEAVAGHLATCPECAGDLRWLDTFRKAAIAQGLRHPAPERIIDLADRRGDPVTPHERRHLRLCARCRAEIDWAIRSGGRRSPVRHSVGLLIMPRQRKT